LIKNKIGINNTVNTVILCGYIQTFNVKISDFGFYPIKLDVAFKLTIFDFSATSIVKKY